VVAFESLGDGSLERKFSNVLERFLDLRQNVAQRVLTIVDADSLKGEKSTTYGKHERIHQFIIVN
jgi:hypothetical protein